jgi:branched-chain amino acid transport system substrate-binding protein
MGSEAQMNRRMAVGLVAVCSAVALTVSGCGNKSTSSSGSGGSESASGAASGLSIVPLDQIDSGGKVVSATAANAPVLPSQLPKSKCGTATIATAGALTGPNAALGINIKDGAQLAVDEHNKANPDCKIVLKPFDTEGDPQKATQVIPQIINDQSIVGLIGPAFSGETKATGGALSQAGLVSTTASATNPTLSTNGWHTFFRGLNNDNQQGSAVGKYLVNTLGYKKVCVIQDDSAYGTGLATAITTGLGSAHDASCDAGVKTGERDFSAVISKVSQAKPDAVFYSGYYAEAAPLAQQFHNQGVNVTFVSGDGTNDPQFVKLAGSAAKGAYLSCPCGPAKDPLKSDYTTAFNQAPGVYSVEGYDLATILMKGIEEGKKTRPELLDFVKTYDGQGVGKHYSWDANGELKSASIWMYKVQ